MLRTAYDFRQFIADLCTWQKQIEATFHQIISTADSKTMHQQAVSRRKFADEKDGFSRSLCFLYRSVCGKRSRHINENYIICFRLLQRTQYVIMFVFYYFKYIYQHTREITHG